MKAVLDRWFYGALYRTGLAPWDIEGPQPSLIDAEAAGFVSGTVLDLGCGRGGNAVFLAERGYTVSGIDLVPTAVSAARRLAAQRRVSVSFSAGDVFQIAETKRYDTLLDFGLLHRFQGDAATTYLHKLSRLADEGASLVFQCFSERAPNWAGFAPRRFTEPELRGLFAGIWDLRELDHAEFRLKWGGSAAAWRGVASLHAR